MASILPEEFISIGFSAEFSYDAGVTDLLDGLRLIDISISGQETEQMDTTDQGVVSNFLEFMSTLTDPGTVTLKLKWDGKVPIGNALLSGTVLPTRGVLTLSYNGKEFWSCDANVKKTGGLDAPLKALVTRAMDFKCSGEPTHTAITDLT
jgi:hypothetical protein